MCQRRIDSILTKSDNLSYKDYQVRTRVGKKPGPWGREAAWEVVLTHKGKEAEVFPNDAQFSDYNRFGFFPLLGGDAKQLIILQYTGGAHCCEVARVYELGDSPRQIFDGGDYDLELGFDVNDLDGDGIFELSESLGTFDYFDRCSHATSPAAPSAIFRYDAKTKKYVPANDRFKSVLSKAVEKDIDELRDFEKKTDFADFRDEDGEYLGKLLSVVVAYLYAGDERRGWEFFDREYRLSDKEKIKLHLSATLATDSFYSQLYARRQTSPK
jgi:hypothetical protein